MLLSLALMTGVAANVRAELVSSVSGIKAGETFLAAVVLRTDPGVHIYWQNPGDAGAATKIDWTLPEGWTASDLKWPTPSRYSEGRSTTFGYEGATILMVQITTSSTTKIGTARMMAKASWMSSDSKEAGSSDLKLSLQVAPVKTSVSVVWGEKLAAAWSGMPKTPDGWKFEAGLIDGGYVLRALPPSKMEFKSGLPNFYPMDKDVVLAGYPQSFLLKDDGWFWLALKKGATAKPEHLRGLLMAPKDSKWPGELTSVLVDVQIGAK
ncbi:hypothetical protein BH11ARM1_BH11ARM1_00440 [soil metagenome]